MQASRRWVIALFAIAFIVARVTGAHLHLCLDGSEPPVQLHVSDSAEVDHHPHAGETHDDMDVDALDSVVAKVAKLDLPPLALLAWTLALCFVVALLQPIRTRVHHPPRPPPRWLRPLLRAPPV